MSSRKFEFISFICIILCNDKSIVDDKISRTQLPHEMTRQITRITNFLAIVLWITKTITETIHSSNKSDDSIKRYKILFKMKNLFLETKAILEYLEILYNCDDFYSYRLFRWYVINVPRLWIAPYISKLFVLQSYVNNITTLKINWPEWYCHYEDQSSKKHSN